MNYIELKGVGDANYTAFDAMVSISDYEENFNVLDGENAGRSVKSGHLIRDIIGAYFGHKVTFRRSGMNAEAVENFDALWTWLKMHSVDDSVWIRAADNQSTIEYKAYYTSGSRKLISAHNGVNYWDEISINFIPVDPQVRP